MGTRVLKHFNGYRDPFGGSVDGYTESTGYYHVTYDDGDSEEMTESDVELYKQATPKAATSPRVFKASTSPKAAQAAPAAAPARAAEGAKSNGHNVSISIPTAEVVASLCNKRVVKSYVDVRGNDAFMNGTVLTYFPANNKFRVLYLDGQCDDLTLDEVMDMIPLSPKSKEEANTRKLQLNNGSPTAKSKKSSSTTTRIEPIKAPPALAAATSPTTIKIVVPKQRPSIQIETEPAVPVMDSSFALTIVRNALYVLVSSAPNATDLKTKLLAVLLKEDQEVGDVVHQNHGDGAITLMLYARYSQRKRSSAL